MSAGPPNQHLF